MQDSLSFGNEDMHTHTTWQRSWHLHVGKCEQHISNLEKFITRLKSSSVDPSDLLVHFDVVPLFTRVPLEISLRLICEKLDELGELCHVLTSTCYSFNGIGGRSGYGQPSITHSRWFIYGRLWGQGTNECQLYNHLASGDTTMIHFPFGHRDVIGSTGFWTTSTDFITT